MASDGCLSQPSNFSPPFLGAMGTPSIGAHRDEAPLNIEMFFLRTPDSDAARAVVEMRLKSLPDPPGKQPDLGLPSSYDALLANEKKRRVALSAVDSGGWVAGIESKEVVDFALMLQIAERLDADILVVQLSEVAGACGYASYSQRMLREHRFNESEKDPADAVRRHLKLNGVRTGLLTFREAVQSRSQGWRIVG